MNLKAPTKEEEVYFNFKEEMDTYEDELRVQKAINLAFQEGSQQTLKDDYKYLLDNWDGYDKTANMIITDFKKRIEKELGVGEK